MLTTRPNFEDFYNSYFDYLYNYTYLRIGMHHETEDIVSETFMALWKDWKKLENGEHAKRLIFKIARNKINDFLRKKYKEFNELTEFDEETISDEKIVKEVLQPRNKLKKKIRSFVLKLDERLKKFFNLRYEQNKTFKEISLEMALTLNNVKVINNRLVKKIKQNVTK